MDEMIEKFFILISEGNYNKSLRRHVDHARLRGEVVT